MAERPHRFSIRLSVMTVLALTLAALCAASVCLAIFTSVYGNSLIKDARLRSEQAVHQATVAVNHRLSSMKSQLTAIRAVAAAGTDAASFEREIAALAAVQEDLFAVTVYDRAGNILASVGSGEQRKQDPYTDLSFDAAAYESMGDFYLSRPHVQTLYTGVYPWVVTLACRTGEPVFGSGAYVAIDFRFSEIAGYIDQVGVGRHGYCYITDAAGYIVYHPQQQVIFAGLKEEDPDRAAMADGTYTESDRICSTETTDDGCWRLFGISYTDELAVERRTQTVTGIAVSLACCAAVSALVFLVYSLLVNRPVHALVHAMQVFERTADSLSFCGGTESVTELRLLSSSFSHMASRIRDLMDEVRQEEAALRKTELQALQAQINPHFLYNTLDSIQWMCEQGKTEEAGKMVSALAKLFRISISRGHELIPIRDELQHAKSYLIIQSYRYRDQFSYRFEVDERLLPFLCNKITLQPLIENAIYHGLDRMVEEGEIVISVREAEPGGDILLSVSDNGVGMTEEQCCSILQKERSDKNGIGVKNVNDRLKIYFGEDYGITIESEPDVGTTVFVRIPRVEKEEHA